MASILIVDDEVPLRLALRNLGDWAACGVDTIHEAANGREALDVLKARPDIAVLLTDIKMPVMDGIELISQASALYRDLAIIVLSSFDDYDLIREAFKRGARDYILKPRMEPDAVVALVNNLLPLTARMGNGTRASPGAARGQWLRMLSELGPGQGLEPIGAPVEGFSFERLAALSLWVDGFGVVHERYLDHSLDSFQESLSDIIDRFLAGRPGTAHVAISPQEYILLIPLQSSSSWSIEVRQGLQELRHQVRHFLDVSLSIGVSSPVSSLQALPAAIREARSLVQMRHILGLDRLILPRDTEGLSLVDAKALQLDFTLLIDQVNGGNFDPALASYRTVLKVLGDCRFPTIEPYQAGAGQILHLLLDLLSQSGIDAAEALQGHHDLSTELRSMESLAGLTAWLDDLGTQIMGTLRKHRLLVTSHHVLKARRYLEAHYQDPDISLEDVAKMVGLSRTYFSTLFEKETGATFTEFLNNLRLSEARRLLKTSNLKLYEISERCGFNSVEYFGRLFRKVCGTTPAQYR